MGQQFQYMRKYIAESPKQGSRRFNYIVKTKYIDDLGIVYLWSAWSATPSSVCTESLVSRISPRKRISQQNHFSQFIRGPCRWNRFMIKAKKSRDTATLSGWTIKVEMEFFCTDDFVLYLLCYTIICVLKFTATDQRRFVLGSGSNFSLFIIQ